MVSIPGRKQSDPIFHELERQKEWPSSNTIREVCPDSQNILFKSETNPIKMNIYVSITELKKGQ